MIRLKFERLNRHLTQKGLARIAGISDPVVCWLENGHWLPTREQLHRLAAALEVSPPEALLDEVLVVPPEPVATHEATV